MSTLNLTANIAVTGGPAVSLQRELTAEAYELLEIDVPASTTDLKVELQPGSGMSLLVVKADPHMKELSFRTAQAADAPVFKIDEPLLLAGGSIVALGSAQPKVLYFSNSTAAAAAKDAKVTVLVARDATPPAP